MRVWGGDLGDHPVLVVPSISTRENRPGCSECSNLANVDLTAADGPIMHTIMQVIHQDAPTKRLQAVR